MTVCVLITGTNAVGKSTLARELIGRYGGIRTAGQWLTETNDRRVCFAGDYGGGGKFGGVDKFNQTKVLKDVVGMGLASHQVIYCEGMYLHTFGLNLTNAAFEADRQLVVFLYAPVAEIDRRLKERSGRGIRNEAVWRKQLNTAAAARKWASIGVPVLSFNTAEVGVGEVADTVMRKVEELCGR